jgi:hypothetical protein
MEFFKSLFKSDNSFFDEITVEFLEKQRQNHLGDEYLKWLRGKSGQLEAILIATKAKSGIIPAQWQDKLLLVQQTIEKERS